MNVLVLAGAALPVVATYLLLQPARRAGASLELTAALALGLGLGLSSCTFFLALVLFDGQRAGVMAIDAALLAIALAVWWRSAAYAAAPRAPLASHERVLTIAVLVAALAGTLSFLANTLVDPHGRWDAWATWNVRARWLADAGAAWREAFPKPIIHGDYPLVLPGSVARLWVYADANDPVVPAAVAFAYGTALVLLLYAAIAAVRGRAHGLVGALCLLGTPLFLRIVPWQYADAPLAFNLLAVVSLLALYDHQPERGHPMLFWAGVAAGLTAWTKNEGMMLLVGIIVVRGALLLVRPIPLRSAAWFAAGLLPPGAIVLYFKLTLAPLSAQFRQTRGQMLTQVVDPQRYGAIMSAVAFELVRGTGPILLALIVFTILLGRTPDRRARSIAAGIWSIIGFAALCYGFTYLTARVDLTWILSHSIDRIVLQVWPSALLASLLYIASPSEHAVRSPAHREKAPVARRRAARR